MRAVWLLFFGCSCAVAHADADAGSSAFDDAIAIEARDPETAAKKLEALATDHPDDPLAPDALTEAATLCEQRLFQPARALISWRAITTRYPGSRDARRAQLRVPELERTLAGAGNEVLSRFERLIAEASDRPSAATRQKIVLFLGEPASLPIRDRGAYWLAQASEGENDFEGALHWYGQASRAPGPWAARADRAKAALLLRRGRFAEARIAYQDLSRHPDPVSRLAQQDGLLALDRSQRSHDLAIAAWVWLALFCAVHVLLARDRPVSVPMEARFLAPVALVFAILAALENRTVGLAVAIVGGGGVIVSWLSAAARAGASLARRALFALAAAIAVVAIAYLAVRYLQLVDLVRETLMSGPDR